MSYRVAIQLIEGERYDSTKTYNGIDIPEPYKIYDSSESTPLGYEDITTILNLKSVGEEFATDYLQYRMWIDKYFNDSYGWSSSNDTEKQVIIDFNLLDRSLDDNTNNTNKVVFLMGKGYSQQEAQGYLIASYAHHHTLDKYSCRNRAESESLTKVVLTYLSVDDATDFIETTKTLVELYEDRAIKGVNYDSESVGFFDFIESTVGTIYENSGLSSKGYVVNIGTTQDFIDAMMDVLVKGNY